MSEPLRRFSAGGWIQPPPPQPTWPLYPHNGCGACLIVRLEMWGDRRCHVVLVPCEHHEARRVA